jgi:hypothetical protein
MQSRVLEVQNGPKYCEQERNVITLLANSMCSHDVWNIDPEPVGTRFHVSAMFHKKSDSQKISTCSRG